MLCGYLQAYIGLPSEAAIYKILRSCITELVRSQLVHSGITQIVPPPYPAAVAACEALPDLFSRICGPENAPHASNSDLDNSGASHMNRSAMNGDGVGDNTVQDLGDLQLGDLKLDVDMRDELVVRPEAAQENGQDSLALVKLGMQLRCANTHSLTLLVRYVICGRAPEQAVRSTTSKPRKAQYEWCVLLKQGSELSIAPCGAVHIGSGV